MLQRYWVNSDVRQIDDASFGCQNFQLGPHVHGRRHPEPLMWTVMWHPVCVVDARQFRGSTASLHVIYIRSGKESMLHPLLPAESNAPSVIYWCYWLHVLTRGVEAWSVRFSLAIDLHYVLSITWHDTVKPAPGRTYAPSVEDLKWHGHYGFLTLHKNTKLNQDNLVMTSPSLIGLDINCIQFNLTWLDSLNPSHMAWFYFVTLLAKRAMDLKHSSNLDFYHQSKKCDYGLQWCWIPTKMWQNLHGWSFWATAVLNNQVWIT